MDLSAMARRPSRSPAKKPAPPASASATSQHAKFSKPGRAAAGPRQRRLSGEPSQFHRRGRRFSLSLPSSSLFEPTSSSLFSMLGMNGISSRCGKNEKLTFSPLPLPLSPLMKTGPGPSFASAMQGRTSSERDEDEAGSLDTWREGQLVELRRKVAALRRHPANVPEPIAAAEPPSPASSFAPPVGDDGDGDGAVEADAAPGEWMDDLFSPPRPAAARGAVVAARASRGPAAAAATATARASQAPSTAAAPEVAPGWLEDLFDGDGAIPSSLSSSSPSCSSLLPPSVVAGRPDREEADDSMNYDGSDEPLDPFAGDIVPDDLFDESSLQHILDSALFSEER